jgi:4-hydroxy-4-methyl-2-oxoglutarate aldolase
MPSDSEAARRLLDLGVVALAESTPGRHLLSGVRLCVGEPFAGPAVTVAIPAGDNVGVHLAIEAAHPGDVVCVASAGRGLYGVVGELLALSARVRDVAALVIDDGIRDLDALVAPPAIAARGVSARGTVKRRVRRPVNADVAIAGALVRLGDWIVGDADGICVIPADGVEDILGRADSRIDRERVVREELRDGAPSRSVLGLPADPPVSTG